MTQSAAGKKPKKTFMFTGGERKKTLHSCCKTDQSLVCWFDDADPVDPAARGGRTQPIRRPHSGPLMASLGG